MISVIIIGHNSCRYLEQSLPALVAQKRQISEIIYIDNNSDDFSINYIMKKYPPILIVKNEINTGFAKAANQGIELAKGEYILLLNPDVILGETYIENALSALINNSDAAAVNGKTLKYDFNISRKSNIIDTIGIVGLSGRRFLDNGAGIEDQNQFEKPMEIFGVSGHCPLFRKKALNDARIGNEIFDENFFMYKEDVDLCWRLRLFGWKFFYTPDAVAYHKRGTNVVKRQSLLESIKARQKLNKFQKYYSFKNHKLMLIKNEFMETLKKDFIKIIVKEFGTFVWTIIFEPLTLKAYLEFLVQLPSTLEKRSQIMKRVRIKPNEIYPWLNARNLIK
jgi:GT2 family glycosyltransferase